MQCTQWCSGKFSLVGTLALHIMVTNTLSLSWGGGGGRVPERMVIYHGKNPCSNKGVCVLDRAVRIYNDVLFYC